MSTRTARQTGFAPRLLGEVLDVKHGYAFKGEFFGDEGLFVIVTPGCFFEEGGFRSREGKEKRYSGEVPDGYVLKKGDLIVAMTEQAEGLLGSAALVPADDLYLHNQRIGRIVIQRSDLADKRFIYYLLNARYVRQQIRASATGTKVRHTAPERIKKVKVGMPPLDVQCRIRTILSAYDDLIENNTRRIAILEEMAGALYHEWFVEFRFPGHEKVLMVESRHGRIPEGWGMGSLKRLVSCVRDTTEPGEHLRDREYVPIECLPRRSLALVESQSWTTAQSSLQLFSQGDILFGAMRPYFHKVIGAPFDGITRSTCFVLRPQENVDHAYAALTMFQDETVGFASAHTRGSTIPYAVWAGGLAEMPVLVPPAGIQQRFGDQITPVLNWISRSYFRQKNLRTTRDLLLPKLVSGEIDVSNLDIAVPEAEA